MHAAYLDVVGMNVFPKIKEGKERRFQDPQTKVAKHQSASVTIKAKEGLWLLKWSSAET